MQCLNIDYKIQKTLISLGLIPMYFKNLTINCNKRKHNFKFKFNSMASIKCLLWVNV